MNRLLLVAFAGVALSACSNQKALQRTALDCPTTEGKLTRVSISQDRKICIYRGATGAEISLRLLPVNGDVDTTLHGVEEALLPPPPADRAGAAKSKDDSVIEMPGVSIRAGENDADIRVGGMTIRAGDDNALIRGRSDVRLKGESLSPKKRGVRAAYFRAGSDLPEGWRYVGYEAGGPKDGPLTIGIIRSRSDADTVVIGVDDDLKRLVRRNAGI